MNIIDRIKANTPMRFKVFGLSLTTASAAALAFLTGDHLMTRIYAAGVFLGTFITTWPVDNNNNNGEKNTNDKPAQ